MQEAEFGAALERLAAEIQRAPQLDALWAQFSELIRFFNLRHPVPDFVRELLGRALEHPAVDPGNLVRPITTLALSRTEGALAEPLLVRMLPDVVIRDAALEGVLVAARRRMLDDAAAFPLETMTAIAHQCFNTEYVFDETPDERARIAELAQAEELSPAQYAAFAAYRPLSTLRDPRVQGSLRRRQIEEPLEERRLAATIASSNLSESSVSAAVRAQYEENPYPRWIRTQTSLGHLQSKDAPRKILVAGCGTGQNAIGTARRFPAAQVLAVDLSLASLAYARRKTLELGIRNIEYRQADILALGTLVERFDLIECSGVLHHLEDPLAGWRALASLLEPGGAMRIGLYSEAGRRPIVRARELIAARGFEPDADGIRACRAAIRQDASLDKVASNEDFFSMSGCRDLLFHVQESRFTLPQIEAMLGELDLSFAGFEFPDSGATLTRYRARFSTSTLGNWHAFEQEFPETFSRMYQFWVRRDV